MHFTLHSITKKHDNGRQRGSTQVRELEKKYYLGGRYLTSEQRNCEAGPTNCINTLYLGFPDQSFQELYTTLDSLRPTSSCCLCTNCMAFSTTISYLYNLVYNLKDPREAHVTLPQHLLDIALDSKKIRQ
jgi:hypothetical protein